MTQPSYLLHPSSEPSAAPPAEAGPAERPAPIPAAELAALLAARMCHDYISPAGAIVSGLDLLDDPSAQDMREEAMNLIAASARKLVSLLAFDRVAFGASAAAESFDVRQLETLSRDVFAHVRAELEWSVAPASLPKAAARALLNLAQLGAGALPTGGVAQVSASETEDGHALAVRAVGTRVRVRPEVLEGLDGRPLTEGLGGHWVQAYYLRQIVDGAGGQIEITTGDGEMTISARIPLVNS